MSIVLVCIDLFASIENKSFSNASKVIRGIFRFLRIILLFRKVFKFLLLIHINKVFNDKNNFIKLF